MRVKVDTPIAPGYPVYMGGYMILSTDDSGGEWVEGIIPGKHAAEEYARATLRGKKWRVVPLLCEGVFCTEDEYFSTEMRLRKL